MTEKSKLPTKSTKSTAKAVPKAAAPESKTVKAAKAPKVAPIIPTVKDIKVEKHKKQKMVRDSFTMPEGDYARIAALKERCIKAGVSAKRSEVLRAALKCLSNLSDKELTKAITDIEIIKTGRPAKN